MQRLDAVLAEDPTGRVACETFVDVDKLVRQVVKDIGYTRPEYAFESGSCKENISVYEAAVLKIRQ